MNSVQIFGLRTSKVAGLALTLISAVWVSSCSVKAKSEKPSPEATPSDDQHATIAAEIGKEFELEGETQESGGMHVFTRTATFTIPAGEELYIRKNSMSTACESGSAVSSAEFLVDGVGNSTKIASGLVDGYQKVSGQFPGTLAAGSYALTALITSSKHCYGVTMNLELRQGKDEMLGYLDEEQDPSGSMEQ